MAGLSNTWGRVVSGSYISTGCFKLEHNLGETNYNVVSTPNQAGIYITLEGKYANYCLLYVRNFSGGLVDGLFEFVIQRTG